MVPTRQPVEEAPPGQAEIEGKSEPQKPTIAAPAEKHELPPPAADDSAANNDDGAANDASQADEAAPADAAALDPQGNGDAPADGHEPEPVGDEDRAAPHLARGADEEQGAAVENQEVENATSPPAADEEPQALDAQDQAPNDPADSDDSEASPRVEGDSTGVLFKSQSPVLRVEATGPRTVMIGRQAEYLVKVRNDGAPAKSVIVSVSIPSAAELAAAEPSVGTAQPAAGDRRDTLEWTIERLEAGSQEVLALKLVPRKSASFDLGVNYTFSPEPSQMVVEVQEPKLAMTLSGPTEVLYGQTKVYKLTISNPGNGDAENTSVGLLPIGRSTEAPGSHRLGTLAAGDSKTIDIELTARHAGAVTIKAHALADGGLRAEAAQQVLVRRASLQVGVEAPAIKFAGTNAAFHVKVENVGDATAEGVQVTALLPPEAKFLSASSGGKHDADRGQVAWTIGSLQAGAQRVFELQAVLAAPGDNRLQFTAAGEGDLSAAAMSNTRVEAIADLKLELRDPQGPIAVGEEAAYEVRLHNRGSKAAEGVELTVFFSEGLEATTAEGGAHDIGAGQVVFKPLATLAAGDTAVFHVRARAEAAGNHIFRAEVTCPSLGTKLASEDATHFYGERRMAALPPGQPLPAAPEDDGPTPAQPNE
jgi:uncharacterized repeat protein (TIGR01451 family)